MSIITNIINKAGSDSTYVSAVCEWLKKQSASYNNKLSAILEGTSNEPFVTDGLVISAQDMRSLFSGELEESQVYIDEIGEQFTVEQVVSSISNENAVFIAKAAALEALTIGDSPVEINNQFFNNLSVSLGNITESISPYCQYLSGVLLSGGSIADKIRHIISGDVPTSAGFTSAPSAQYTGVNPFIGLCNNINIDWSDPLNAIAQAAVGAYNASKVVFDGLIEPAAKWLKRKAVGIVKAVADPIDVQNVEGGQDLSFNDCFYQVSLNIPCPTDWRLNHDNSYCCVVVLGATLYFHINGLYIDYVYVKKHLYDPYIAEQLYTALTSSIPTDWTKFESVVNSSTPFIANIKEDTSEIDLYKGMLYTERLIYAGLHLASGLPVSDFVRDYSPEDYSPSIDAFCNNTIQPNNITSVNNGLWYDELSKGHVDDYFLSSYRIIFTNLIDNLESGNTFYPYSWVSGPLSGSYSIKTDNDNIEAVSSIIKTFVVATLVVVAGVVAVKSFVKLKSMAVAAMRNYDLAYYDKNVDSGTLKKLRRKANFLKAISGTNFAIPSFKNNSSSDNDELISLIRG